MTWLALEVGVVVGAALGASLRFLVSGWLDDRGDLPWGTLLVNVSGSLVLGWAAARGLQGSLAALVGAGFCGGLTTYSSFAVQTVALGWRRGTAYAVLTTGAALGACALGFALSSSVP